MELSDAQKYNILKRLSISDTKSQESLLNIIEFSLSIKEGRGDIMSQLIWDNYIKWNTQDKTVAIIKTGDKFMSAYRWKLRRERFNEWAKFLQSVIWFITFIASIILNIYFIYLRYFKF